jgi:hypothetical protein
MPGTILEFIYATIATNGPGSGAIVAILFAGIPVMLGLLVTSGDWRAVLRGSMIWLVLLFGSMLVLTGGDVGRALFGGTVYGMATSTLAVPLLALAVRLVERWRARWVAG